MSWYIDCINCGKQVSIDGPEDKCYWCGKNASKKEVIVKEQEVAEKTGQVPVKPTKRKAILEYYNQNREAVLADYKSMRIVDFLPRWHMSTSLWMRLKADWHIQGKDYQTRIPIKKEPVAAAKPSGSPKTDESQVVELTEHERYLVLLGYQQAVREFLKHCCNI